MARIDVPRSSGTSPAPWHATISPLIGPAHATVGTWSWTHDTQQAMNGYYRNSPGTQNNYAAWDLLLGDGTWAFDVLYVKSSGAGIMKLQLDDGAGVFTDLGTIDAYNATIVYNNRSSITGVAVTGGTIKRRLRVMMDTKNASASAYQGFLSGIQARRTA